MALMRPFGDIQNQMERMFNDFLQTTGMAGDLGEHGRSSGMSRTFMPPIELLETDKDFTLRIEIPGIHPEDVQVEVQEHQVVVNGECREERRAEGKGENLYRSEFRYGRFLRRIPLPQHVKGEEAQADFQNGILEIKLPKLEEARGKRLKINVKR